MKVTGIFCPWCYQFIYSRAQHDFHWCACKSVAIDGGQGGAYTKVCSNLKDATPIGLKVDMDNVTKEKLYRDWNRSFDDMGYLNLIELGKFKTTIIRDKTGKAPGCSLRARLYQWLTRGMPKYKPMNRINYRWSMWLIGRMTVMEHAYIQLSWAERGNIMMLSPDISKEILRMCCESAGLKFKGEKNG